MLLLSFEAKRSVYRVFLDIFSKFRTGHNVQRCVIFRFPCQNGALSGKYPSALIEKWHLIQNQPSLRQIFKEPPLISYKRGKSLKDILVRAKL